MGRTAQDLFLDYALSFLGVEYVWGGNSRFTGLDCSGLVVEVLKAFGFLGSHEDQNSQGLYERFKKNPRGRFPASLLFFGKDEEHITHVAIALNHNQMIESAPGTSKTDSKEKARALNACVRIRPIDSRGDLVAAIEMNIP